MQAYPMRRPLWLERHRLGTHECEELESGPGVSARRSTIPRRITEYFVQRTYFPFRKNVKAITRIPYCWGGSQQPSGPPVANPTRSQTNAKLEILFVCIWKVKF